MNEGGFYSFRRNKKSVPKDFFKLRHANNSMPKGVHLCLHSAICVVHLYTWIRMCQSIVPLFVCLFKALPSLQEQEKYRPNHARNYPEILTWDKMYSLKVGQFVIVRRGAVFFI